LQWPNGGRRLPFTAPGIRITVRRCPHSNLRLPFPSRTTSLASSARRSSTTEKRDAYLTIPSLRVLIFAETDRPALVVYRRQADGGFEREDHAGLDAVLGLPEIETALPLAEVYEGVEF